jgi:hypothetical protein
MVTSMAYNMEKYRDKREKVLGMKKRGIGFGTFALLISAGIMVGLSLVVIPKSISYLRDRELDDAIYRIGKNLNWPKESIGRLRDQPGVKMVMTDVDDKRIVVTFNRTRTNTERLSSFFIQENLQTILLNKVNHRQRLHSMDEEKRFEAL